jgi:integrase/recombinase XerD
MQVWRKQSVRWVLNGKHVPKGTPNAVKETIRSKRFYGTLNAYDGRKRQVPLTEDKATSETLLRRLRCDEDSKRANGVDRFHDHRRRPLLEFVDEYEAFLTSKGNTPKHVRAQKQRIVKLLAATKARTSDELDAAKILKALSDWRSRKAKSFNVQTTNSYLIAIKGFSRWLWTEKKTPDDALAGLRRMNAEVDRRRVRRALTTDELQRLLLTTQTSRTHLGKDWRLRGVDRAMIYEVAAFTGLRLGELGKLTKSMFDFDTGTLTLEASNVKNRKRTVLPLHPSLAVKLRSYASGLSTDQLWPGTWSKQSRGGKILRCDLKRAGIAHVDASGRYADFHSLRYTFITNLAKSGVHPSKAQRLARHSTVNLTMSVYTALNVDDLRDAVAALPVIHEQNSKPNC